MTMPATFRLRPDKRVLFLTKDPLLIRRQLAGELDLRMEDLSVDELDLLKETTDALIDHVERLKQRQPAGKAASESTG